MIATITTTTVTEITKGDGLVIALGKDITKVLSTTVATYVLITVECPEMDCSLL